MWSKSRDGSNFSRTLPQQLARRVGLCAEISAQYSLRPRALPCVSGLVLRRGCPALTPHPALAGSRCAEANQMPTHWSYAPVDKGTLMQGDVLQRSPKLEAVLSEIHPYFAKERKYVNFMLLTQSCDLVRREGGTCKAPYLTVAAVRSIRELIERKELPSRCEGRHLHSAVEVAALDELRRHLIQIINNASSNYYFLRGDQGAGLGDDSCACLRVSIPLKLMHYDTLLEAKVGQLDPVFQAKLGSMVGLSFSRVGTQDWPQDDLDRLVGSLLEPYRPVERKQFDNLKKAKKANPALDSDDGVRNWLDDDKNKPLSKWDELRQGIKEVWAQGLRGPVEAPKSAEELIVRLENSKHLRGLK
jgi:hypothetical protein